jgi:hypothetical protein
MEYSSFTSWLSMTFSNRVCTQQLCSQWGYQLSSSHIRSSSENSPTTIITWSSLSYTFWSWRLVEPRVTGVAPVFQNAPHRSACLFIPTTPMALNIVSLSACLVHQQDRNNAILNIFGIFCINVGICTSTLLSSQQEIRNSWRTAMFGEF